jgi:acyl-CoA thioester hydrolase
MPDAHTHPSASAASVTTRFGGPWLAHLPIRVRYQECDVQSVVFNAHYLAYFDMATLELWRAIYGSHADLVADGYDTVAAAAHVEYLAPARFDDELVARAGIRHLGTTSLIIAFEISREDTTVATGEVHYVFVEPGSSAKKAPGGRVRELLAAAAAAG